MGIQYFYNFCLKEIDDTDLESDILSAVRKSYFAANEKIRDKITYDSEGVSMLYDYCIERDKPLRWTVRNPQGGLVQEVLPADSGRYYLCFYRGDTLFKRLLFSKFHTLLKVEYMDDSGSVARSVEPRKVQGGLCLLYTDAGRVEPIVLSEMPDVTDDRVAQIVHDEFGDYTVSASTDVGIVWYMTDEQTARFKAFVEQTVLAVENEQEESFVGGDTPLLDKINAKDFNMKRNLSASLDISQAKSFSAPADQDIVEEETIVDGSDETVVDDPDETVVDTPAEISKPDTGQTPENPGLKPDKEIMADGAVYTYYGELDDNGNRSGHGRTLTDQGRTAYEGAYRNDKRSGKGAYFYKDGTLCYSGDWSENVRHGVGVGVSSRDGSMHVGRWVNNKPEGNGVRLSAEGEIRFVCKELSDGETVLMNFLDDDTVLISKYDKNGSKLSEKKISLID
ncbi:MAG: hypothetical protein IJG87_06220 [Ruminococcus sp.]|nr:hypothetical protein [Ruminococcus sp.]